MNLFSEMELGPYLLCWFDRYAYRLARNTARGYLVNIRSHIIPRLGSVRLCDLRPLLLEDFYAALRADGLSGTTCLYVHSVLRKALNSAVRWELLPRNPAELLEAPRKSRQKIAPLRPGEVAALVEGCQAYPVPCVRMAVLLGLLLGLRRGEVLGLQWKDFDFLAGTVSIRRTATPDKAGPGGYVVSEPKTANSVRTLLLASTLAQCLGAWQSQAEPNPEGFLFWYNGALMRSCFLVRHFHRILDACGLSRIRFHDLRHTNATFLLQANVPAKIVSVMLGHSGIGVTMDIYAHVLTEMQRPASEAVGRLLADKPPLEGPGSCSPV